MTNTSDRRKPAASAADLKGINLRHWRSFEATATLGSVSRASEALEIAQSVVSVQVKQLEEAIGCPLFEKRARPMVLTTQGQVMLRHARAILSEMRMAEDAAIALAHGMEGVLHLGMVMPANYFAPLLVRKFSARHPTLRIEVSVGKRAALLTELAEYRLDLAITGYPPVEAEVDAQTFARHHHVIVAPANHPLAGRDLAWSDLADEPVVLREIGSSTRQLMEHVWQSRGIRPHTVLTLPGNETVKSAVMSGLGISLMSAHAIQVELDCRRLSVLRLPQTPLSLDWCVLHRRDRPLSVVAARFREMLLEDGLELTACRLGE